MKAAGLGIVGAPRRVLLLGTGAAFSIQTAGAAAKYCLFVLFARWMGAGEFGAFAFALAALQILAMVGGVGAGNCSLRFVPTYAATGDWQRMHGVVRGMRLAVGSAGLFLALALTPVLMLSGRWVLNGTPRAVLLLALWVAPLSALMLLHQELIRALHHIVSAYLFPVLVQPLVAGVLAWTLYAHSGVLRARDLLAAYGASYLLVLVIQSVVLRRRLPPRARIARPQYEWRRWLGVSLPLLLVSAFQVILAQADVIVVGSVRGSEAAGLYSAASRTANLVSFVLLAVNAVAAPLISSLFAAGDERSLRSIISYARLWMIVPAALLAAALIVFGHEILSLFGTEFQEASGALSVLCVGQLVNAAAGPVGYTLILTGWHVRAAVVYGVSAVIQIAGCVALTHSYGLVGASIATASATILWNAWLVLLVNNRLRQMRWGGTS